MFVGGREQWKTIELNQLPDLKKNRISETDIVDRTGKGLFSKYMHFVLPRDLVGHFINMKMYLELTDLFRFQGVGLPEPP